MKKEKTKNQYSVFNNIYFFYKKLYEFKPQVIWMTIASIAFGVTLPVFDIYFPKVLLDLVTGGADAQKFILMFGGFVLSYILAATISSYVSNGKYMDYNYFRNYLMYFIFNKSLRINYKNAESGKYRDKYWSAINQLNSGDWCFSSEFYDVVPRLIIAVLNFLIYSTVIGTLHPAIVFILIILSLLNYGLLGWERKCYKKVQPLLDDLGRKINHINMAAGGNESGASGAKDLRIFHLERWIQEKQNDLIGQQKAYNEKIKKIAFLRESMTLTLGLLRDIAAYSYLIIQAVNGNITAGDFVLYLRAIFGFSDFVEQIIEDVQDILGASDRAQNYREYYDLEDEKVEEGTVAIRDLRFPLEIEFKHVSFAYDKGKEILSDLSFHIKPGEKIAIVGVNGAGKTTIVKLLCGFYEPSQGEITINGIDIRNFAKKDLYHLFSTVFQENRCFPFSVGENLTLQKQDKIDEERAYAALEQAGILGKFRERDIQLKDYMTHYFLHDGVVLSGGEMQRFMLARAIYKDAPVLVLDEPTAALDPLAESEIYREYAKMSQGKSAIFISHRLASTRLSDKIFFLKDGKIFESGSHEELMKMNGEYAHMFEIQASYYKSEEGGREYAYGFNQ